MIHLRVGPFDQNSSKNSTRQRVLIRSWLTECKTKSVYGNVRHFTNSIISPLVAIRAICIHVSFILGLSGSEVDLLMVNGEGRP